MEIFISFLYWMGLIIGLPIVILVIHSIQFNAWKENFSKDGLKRHVTELITILLIWIGYEIIKSKFTKKEKDIEKK